MKIALDEGFEGVKVVLKEKSNKAREIRLMMQEGIKEEKIEIDVRREVCLDW